MFLSVLNPQQQQMFLAAARAVAEQDGVLAQVEEALLDAIAAECGQPPEGADIAMEDVLDRLPDALANDVHATNAFLLELAGVAVVDGHAHPAEMAVLSRIAQVLAVDDETLEEFVRFASDARDLAARGRLLIATGNGS